MTDYERLYRLGLTPWERCGTAALETTRVRLDREEAERDWPLGRSLDLSVEPG